MRALERVSEGRRVSLECWLVIAFVPLLGAGCRGEVLDRGIPISGKVTYKGEPLKGGMVLYEPLGSGGTAKTASKDAEIKSAGRTAVGYIRLDGSFTMNTSPDIPGVVPGKYQIAVLEGEASAGPGKSAAPSASPAERDRKPTFPKKYQQPTTSGLADTVSDQHSGTFDINLVD